MALALGSDHVPACLRLHSAVGSRDATRHPATTENLVAPLSRSGLLFAAGAAVVAATGSLISGIALLYNEFAPRSRTAIGSAIAMRTEHATPVTDHPPGSPTR